jgi:hypothetical protein
MPADRSAFDAEQEARCLRGCGSVYACTHRNREGCERAALQRAYDAGRASMCEEAAKMAHRACAAIEGGHCTGGCREVAAKIRALLAAKEPG